MVLMGLEPSRRGICDTDTSHKRSVASWSGRSVTSSVPRKVIRNLHVGEIVAVVPIPMRTISGVTDGSLVLRLVFNALRTQGFTSDDEDVTTGKATSMRRLALRTRTSRYCWSWRVSLLESLNHLAR